MVLKHVGVLSVAKIMAVMYAAMGLLFGIGFAAFFSLIPLAAASGNNNIPGWLAPMFGIGSLVFAPLFYGAMGFIGGAVSAVIYNLFAGMVGGIQLELETVTKP